MLSSCEYIFLWIMLCTWVFGFGVGNTINFRLVCRLDDDGWGLTESQLLISDLVMTQLQGTSLTHDAGSVQPAAQRLAQPVPISAADKAEALYQGIMASLPTFIKKSVPSQITLGHIDGFSTYFSTPFDKVDTRLPLPRDQVILPRIEAGSTDPDLTPGYTAVYVESFSYGMRMPLSTFVNCLLISINRAPVN
ncbi:hypothetical protein LIER_12066 [Lithospermum erythrorhizon]|uniref:Uncharacterized protein n=1 Tax=Lithospermum erythrorhizon TaxID=34254 RepID=A0AAV3PUD7_LITER